MSLSVNFSVFSNEATLVNIHNGCQIAVDFLHHSKNWRKELKKIGAAKLTDCCVLEYQVDWWGDLIGTADAITVITDKLEEEDFQTLNAAINAEWREDFITLLGRVQRGEVIAHEYITTDEDAVELYKERFADELAGHLPFNEQWAFVEKLGCHTAYGWLDCSSLIIG